MWPLIKKSYAAWNADDGQRMGAALAYYAVFALTPMLMIAVAIAGMIFGGAAAQSFILSGVERTMGSQSSDEIRLLLAAAARYQHGTLANAVGAAALLLGAVGGVAELRSALNRIWDIPDAPSSVGGFIRTQLSSLALVLALGALLAASLFFSASAAALGALLPIPEALLHVLNFAASIAAVTPVFAMVYRFLPRERHPWRDVWTGAAVTALFFALGNVVLGIYIGKSALSSVYGAAGSLVAIMVWTYYCAQILYLGAEFTHVCAESRKAITPAR